MDIFKFFFFFKREREIICDEYSKDFFEKGWRSIYIYSSMIFQWFDYPP